MSFLSQNGLSLVELLVTLVIVSLLAGIGIRSYSAHVHRTKHDMIRSVAEQAARVVETRQALREKTTENTLEDLVLDTDKRADSVHVVAEDFIRFRFRRPSMSIAYSEDKWCIEITFKKDKPNIACIDNNAIVHSVVNGKDLHGKQVNISGKSDDPLNHICKPQGCAR